MPCASGSDYSGGSVCAANAKWFNDNFGSKKWVHAVWGGYNTYAIAVGLTGLLLCDDSTFDSVCDALEGLDGYPVFDDDTLSTLESEWTDSAWDSWAADSFRRAVEKRFADSAEFNWPSDNELRSVFEELAGNADEYWYNEGDGDSMYIDVDKIVESIDLDDCEGENGRDGLADYVVNYEVAYNDGGEVREDYSCEADAAGRVEKLRSAGFAGRSTLRVVRNMPRAIVARPRRPWLSSCSPSPGPVPGPVARPRRPAPSPGPVARPRRPAPWLSPVAVARGCRPWLSPVAVARGCRPWLSPCGCRPWLSPVAVARGCRPWLSPVTILLDFLKTHAILDMTV